MPAIDTVTVPPQTVVPVTCETTLISQFIGSPFWKLVSGPPSTGGPSAIEVFPDGCGVAVGDDVGVGVAVGVAVGVGDALALGDGETLEASDELDVVAVVDELLVLTTCGLGVGEVDDVQPATKIVAITVATTSKDRRLFLMFFAQIALHAARI
jgi:hypothetical protein